MSSECIHNSVFAFLMIASLSLVKLTVSQLQGQYLPLFFLIVNGHLLRGAIVKGRGEVRCMTQRRTLTCSKGQQSPHQLLLCSVRKWGGGACTWTGPLSSVGSLLNESYNNPGFFSAVMLSLVGRSSFQSLIPGIAQARLHLNICHQTP